MRAAVLGVVLSVAAAPLAVVGAATPVAADATTDPGLTGFRDLVVDEPHGHVYVSQGNATLVVTDLAGNRVGTVEGLHGASGMTLSPDGATLFVALSNGDSIAAVDTGSLEVRETFFTGAATCPTDVAITEGLVWFDSGCQSWNSLAALDPDDGSVTGGLAGSLYNPVLRTSPALPGQIFVVERGLSPTTLFAYSVQGGDQPSARLRISRRDTGSNAGDLAFTPDGTKVIQASGAPYQHHVFRTSDLSNAGAYDSDAYPNAVAVRADGVVAAGIAGLYEPDVYVYRAGSTSLFRSYEFGGTDRILQPGGLAFGKRHLYAVTGSYTDETGLRLEVLDLVGIPFLDVQTDRERYHSYDTAHVTATLHAESPNQTVSLYSVHDGERVLLESGPVDEVSHELSSDLVLSSGATTFVAEYTGEGDVPAATASRTVQADKLATTLSVTTDRSGYAYGEAARVTVDLDSGSPDNRRVMLVATTDGVETPLLDGPVGSDNRAVVDHVITGDTTFAASYAGDDDFAAASASKQVDLLLRDATVTVDTDRSAYRYGQRASVSVGLETESGNRTVEVYRSVAGASTLVDAVDVPVDGVARLAVGMEERSELLVTYAGDHGTRSASDRVVVPVAARVSSSLHGFDRVRSRFHVYDAGDRVLIDARVTPDHAGQCVEVRVQHLVDGFFRGDDLSGCVRLREGSQARKGFWSTRDAEGDRLRLRVEWGGDGRNLADVSRWRYVRFE